MVKYKTIPIEALKELINYNPENGELLWRPRPISMFKGGGYNSQSLNAKAWNTRYAGKQAFRSKSQSGYFQGGLFDSNYFAHRVIWALHYGEWPSQHIDHINGVRTDNRIENLRVVDDLENARNMARRKGNRSGAQGVWWDQVRRKWQVSIGGKGYIGYFAELHDAVEARKNAEIELGYHPNHGREANEGV